MSSGQAAETIALLNIAEAGDHIVSSSSHYGGTYNLFPYTLPKLGITVSFVDNPDDPASWRTAVRPNTKAFFGETIANPKNDILDIKPTGPGRGKVHTGGLGGMSGDRENMKQRFVRCRLTKLLESPIDAVQIRSLGGIATVPKTVPSLAILGLFRAQIVPNPKTAPANRTLPKPSRCRGF